MKVLKMHTLRRFIRIGNIHRDAVTIITKHLEDGLNLRKTVIAGAGSRRNILMFISLDLKRERVETIR
jgi:hypothetical protein